MRAWRTALGAVGLALGLPACDVGRHLVVTQTGNGAPDAAPAATGIPLDQLVTGYLAVNCQWLAKCQQWPNMETCEADLLPTYQKVLQDAVAGAGAGRIHYDAVAAATCFDEVANQAWCAISAASPTCAKVFTGTAPAGDGCFANDECQSRLCGNYTSADACCARGTCLPRLAAGAPCTANDHCVDGYACAATGSASPGTCQPLRAAGQPCASQADCEPALQCDRAGSGLCTNALAIGQACKPNGPTCDRISGFCDDVSGTCQARLPVGAACRASTQDATSGCVRYATCTSGVCTFKPGLGEACQVPDGGDAAQICRAGRCTNGTCQTTTCPVCAP
jgi:hypothetical protein